MSDILEKIGQFGLVPIVKIYNVNDAVLLAKALIKAGLKDGMTISTHHHFRNGDLIANQIFDIAKELGVKKCGATHCTGDKAIGMFKKAFGENYIPMGTGKVFEITDENE